MEALGTPITRVISGGDGAKRANGKELGGADQGAGIPRHPRGPADDLSVQGCRTFPLLVRVSPDMEQHGGIRKACLPQDGHRAELRLDPEETSLSSISIRALRSQLLGRTQRPIQEGCSSESQQMSRGVQEGAGKWHSAWHQPHWGPPRASGRGGLRSAATGSTLCVPSNSFL